MELFDDVRPLPPFLWRRVASENGRSKSAAGLFFKPLGLWLGEDHSTGRLFEVHSEANQNAVLL